MSTTAAPAAAQPGIAVQNATKSAQDTFNYYHNLLNKELSQIPFLVQLEKQTNVPKTYVASGVAIVVFVLVFFNVWGSLFCNLVGFAIESKGNADDIQWLTYWTVFAFFNLLEFFSDILLYWLPLYYTMKLILVLWLVLPQTRGAEIIYKQMLRPILLAEEKKIDSVSAKIQSKVNEAASEISHEFNKND